MEQVYKLTLETSYGAFQFIVEEEQLQLFLRRYFTKEQLLLNNIWVEHEEINEVHYQREPFKLSHFDMAQKNERIY